MGFSCFRLSFSSSTNSKASLSLHYTSPLPVAKTQAGNVSIVEKKVHFSSTENARIESMSPNADSKQSSLEGESYSYESLFSLQLVNGWNTPNEEEVMSKEIHNNADDDIDSKNEDSDKESTFPTPIHSKGHNDDEAAVPLSGVANEKDSSCESEEASIEISLSTWLADLEPENSSTYTPISSSNAVKDSINEKRRVLGELNNGGIYENHPQSLKRRLRKEDQKVDLLHKAVPLGLNLARSAICKGMV